LVRRAWAAASVLAIVAGIVLTATQVRVDYFDTELSFRGAAHDDLVRVLDSAPVQEGLACGPLFVPSHKLVPDARWILGASADEVLPRADPDTPAPRRGVALIVNSRIAIFKQAWSSPSDPATIQSPPAGWPRVVASDYYAAYARC
jgi:hypothetical protein